MAWSGVRPSTLFDCCTGPRRPFDAPQTVVPTPIPTPGRMMFDADTPWLLPDGSYFLSGSDADVILADLADGELTIDSLGYLEVTDPLNITLQNFLDFLES